MWEAGGGIYYQFFLQRISNYLSHIEVKYNEGTIATLLIFLVGWELHN